MVNLDNAHFEAERFAAKAKEAETKAKYLQKEIRKLKKDLSTADAVGSRRKQQDQLLRLLRVMLKLPKRQLRVSSFQVDYYLSLFYSKMIVAMVNLDNAHFEAERFAAKAKEAETKAKYLQKEIRKLKKDLSTADAVGSRRKQQDQLLRLLRVMLKLPKRQLRWHFRKLNLPTRRLKDSGRRKKPSC
ncbi:hypothetical protein COCNU_16G001140 [Cocos nucifera]|uniref:Uncharacterized protein n=1 Tax=Cocos nucifera TaxID=13894 RepID=A0A8K0IXM3_COCNU|nr:hypothetical protein COCNU_16G001140 [Cocos nucifera]